jgi:hypothetical protein
MANDFYQRFNLDYQSRYARYSHVIDVMLRNAISLKRRRNFCESQVVDIPARKDAQEFMEYRHPETAVRRDISNDRVFPLETVELQRLRREKTLINFLYLLFYY